MQPLQPEPRAQLVVQVARPRPAAARWPRRFRRCRARRTGRRSRPRSAPARPARRRPPTRPPSASAAAAGSRRARSTATAGVSRSISGCIGFGQAARVQEPGRGARAQAAQVVAASPPAPRRRRGCPAPRSASTAGRSRRPRASPGRRARSARAAAPVISVMRCTKVGPTRLTMRLSTCVAMISRFSGWRGMQRANFSRSSAGK